MRVTINGVEITINFSHETMDNGQKLTKCTMLQPISSNPEVPLGFLGIGYATCSLKDNFNKEAGRQISLFRAIDDCGFDRNVKRTIITKYKTWGKTRNLKHLNHV